MEKGKISVIIPVYNGAACLEECVQSVLDQTCQNFEILIVDDSSTDGTREIAERLAQSDGRIQTVRCTERGVSGARNEGLLRTDGEYVTFVDADDKVDGKMFQTLLACMEKEKSCLAICGFYEWRQKNDSVSTYLTENSEKPDYSEKKHKYKEVCKKKNTFENDSENYQKCNNFTEYPEYSEKTHNSENNSNISDISESSVITMDTGKYVSDYLLRGNTRCWSVLYRRDTIGDTRFRENLTIGEDMMFLVDLLPKVDRVSVTDYKGYYYRINQAGAMLRPFQPSYMDEIKSWRLAGAAITQAWPEQKARLDSILAVSAMLAAGKLAALPSDSRRRYADFVRQCRQTVLKALRTKGARKELPSGYRVKTALFSFCPSLYLILYHLWKRN